MLHHGKLASPRRAGEAFRCVTTTTERKHIRYAHEAQVTLVVAGKAIEGRTTNVSRGGLCADLADEVAVGTELEVSLALVFENEEQSEALTIPARVAWCTSVDEGHQLGLMFKPMNAELAKYLGMFLRFLDTEERIKNDKRRDAPVDERFG
jgi:PilZ domain